MIKTYKKLSRILRTKKMKLKKDNKRKRSIEKDFYQKGMQIYFKKPNILHKQLMESIRRIKIQNQKR